MQNGNSRHLWRLRRAAFALFLASTSAPIWAGSSATTGSSDGAAEAQSSTPRDEPRDIVVTGQALFPDIQPERNLDQTAIESYGVGTVDELIQELQAELGEEDPLILVNGVRVDSLDDIGAFPIEVIRNLQVLPRGSAVRLGGSTGQRVISLTLKKDVRSATVTAAPKFSTDGNWHAVRGEGILTRVRGPMRANLAFRVRNESSLLESERGILQPDPNLPYAIGGNVSGLFGGQIDPLLSALAGEPVTVARLPTTGDPSLSDFLANANQPEITDLGQFRTLKPSTRNYDLNGTFSDRLAPWLTGTATLHWTRSTSRSLRGLPSAFFILAATNPASPFSNDVGLAVYGKDPLRFRSVHEAADANVRLNAQWGSWTADFNFKHNDFKDTSRSERQALFGFIPLDDSIDPFTTNLSDLIAIRPDRTSARSIIDKADLIVTGPALQLPAGPATATMEAWLTWNRLRSQSTFSAFGNGRFRRNEQAIRGALDLPITSRANNVLPQLGDLSANAEYSRIHYSDAGSLDHYALGLTWEPVPALRLRGSIEQTKAPAAIQMLGNPVTISSDVRTFDPLTDTTVDVSQITGGNPAILPQTTKVRRVGALLRLVPKLNLQLNAEYTDTDIRNFVSSLPEASAAVMLAFPDRFIRDSNGVLTTVDLRPVNFDSDREKRLRWGVSMNAKVAGGTAPPAANGSRPAQRTPTTYLQLTVNHSMVFSDRIVIRPGLAPVDVLGGGAIGIGGGRLRHQVDGTAAITSGGIGARMGVTWRGPSRLESRIGGTTDTLSFSPVFILNLRAFADISRFVPHSAWAKGLRLSVDVLNATNDRQKVRDTFGSTPLQYQPAYRDPLGRTIEIEIRKVF
ncbi:MAG: hypothetical protein ACTHN4_05335 [Sphingomicrobium sp.]